AVYNRLIASLPPGMDNLVHSVVVPSHTPDRPISFLVKGCIPNVPHIMHVTSEWGSPPNPTVAFVPKSVDYPVSVALAHGPNTIVVQDNQGNSTKFLIAVTHYATLFRAEAREITEHSA